MAEIQPVYTYHNMWKAKRPSLDFKNKITSVILAVCLCDSVHPFGFSGLWCGGFTDRSTLYIFSNLYCWDFTYWSILSVVSGLWWRDSTHVSFVDGGSDHHFSYGSFLQMLSICIMGMILFKLCKNLFKNYSIDHIYSPIVLICNQPRKILASDPLVMTS